jgi:hypothetical protein
MSKKKVSNLYQTKSGTIRLRNKAGGSSNAGLANQVLFFPTPTASAGGENHKSGCVRKGHGVNLIGRVKELQMLPTPTTQDAKNNGSQSQMERNSLPLNAVAGGKLNPEWVEWLMGYPAGWTDLKD